MLLGALQAAEQAVALFAEKAGTQHWGDYALYDCTACHHELRLPRARQQRLIGEVPGRPRLLEWPSALLDVAISIADTSGKIELTKQELQQAVNQTPFGEPQRCSEQARELSKALLAVADELSSIDIQSPMALNVLKKLTQTSRTTCRLPYCASSHLGYSTHR